jgi:hypothetical protein
LAGLTKGNPMSKKSERKKRTPTSVLKSRKRQSHSIKLPYDKYEFYESYFGFFEEDEDFIAIRKIDEKQLQSEEIFNTCRGGDLSNAVSSLGFDNAVAHKVVDGLMKNKKVLLNVQSGAAIVDEKIIEGSFKFSSPECQKNEDSVLITTQSIHDKREKNPTVLEELKNLNKEST